MKALPDWETLYTVRVDGRLVRCEFDPESCDLRISIREGDSPEARWHNRRLPARKLVSHYYAKHRRALGAPTTAHTPTGTASPSS